ncbi:uncharacterized protein LOC108904310 [Anoplophora glabripennis]|uniref:uncharacterized protein LOC108904310 n=1 Tax=Anoplophora glabripennis TaxID=217634 RepID=UPI0008745D06|nr:uncharacterized protein LOC108904310 [Anoplophora glabripennis]
MMDIFSCIKDCLLTYNYPLVHSMNEEEIADIFKISNRCFLITWMLKLIDSAYEEVLVNFENDKEFLGNIVCELGLCSKKVKIPFMEGELPVTQQVKIIYNICTYIIDIKKYKDEEKTPIVSSDDLEALVNTDLNLFPMYGDIKLLNPSERAVKEAVLQKELETVRIDEQSTETRTEDKCLLENGFNEAIQEFIEKLRMEFPKIKSAMEMVNRNSCLETNNIIELQPDLVETLKESCKNLKLISQFIKDINTIENFECDFGLKEQGRKNNSTYNMIKMLHKEVLTVLKYSRYL